MLMKMTVPTLKLSSKSERTAAFPSARPGKGRRPNAVMKAFFGGVLPALMTIAAPALSQTTSPRHPDAAGDAHPAPFVHPGMLHTLDDLDRIKEKVGKGAEPWKSTGKRS